MSVASSPRRTLLGICLIVGGSYAVPLPSGVETSQVIADRIAAGLHVNGIVGAVLALICVALVRERRSSDATATR